MKLRTKGLKAADQEVILGRLNFITGPNESGKSTILEALRFLALGYSPALGKRPQDTAALMRDGQIQVTAEIDANRVIERMLERMGEGKYRGTAFTSWLSKATSTEHAAAILGLFGSEEQDVAECLDIRQLLSATPQQRATRISALLEAGRKSATDRLALVARLAVQRLAGIPDERMPPDYKQALAVVPPAQAAAIKATSAMLQAKIAEGTEMALTWANAQKREAASGLERKHAARAEVEKRLAAHPVAEPHYLSQLEEQRVNLEREIGAATQRRQDADAKIERSWTALKNLEIAQAKHKAAQEALQKAQDARKSLGDPQVIQAQLDALTAPVAPPMDPKAEEMGAEAKRLREEAQGILIVTVDSGPVAVAQERLDALLAQEASLEASPWHEVVGIGSCLCDLAKAMGWPDKPGDHADQVHHHGIRLITLGQDAGQETPMVLIAKIDHARMALAAAQVAKTDAFLVHDANEQKVRELRGRAEKLEADAEGLGREAHEAYCTRLISQRDDLGIKIRRHDNEIAIRQADISRACQMLAAAEQRVKDCPETPAEPGPSPELLRQRTECLDRLAAIQATAAIRTEFESIVHEIDQLDAERTVYAALEWALQRAREREITEAGGPLVQRMRLFLQGAGRREIPYFRAGKGVCEIGWRTMDGHDVAIQVLSGGGWTLFAAALTAAVVILRGAPVSLLMVEAGETDEEMLSTLLCGVEAVSSEIGIAIVATPRPLPGGHVQWNVISPARCARAVT